MTYTYFVTAEERRHEEHMRALALQAAATIVKSHPDRNYVMEVANRFLAYIKTGKTE